MASKKKPATATSKRVRAEIARENRPTPTVGVSNGPGDPRVTVAVPTMTRAINQKNRGNI